MQSTSKVPCTILLLDLDGTVSFSVEQPGKSGNWQSVLADNALRFARHFDWVVPFSKAHHCQLVNNFAMHIQLNTGVQDISVCFQRVMRRPLVEAIKERIVPASIPFVALTPDLYQPDAGIGHYYESLLTFEQEFQEFINKKTGGKNKLTHDKRQQLVRDIKEEYKLYAEFHTVASEQINPEIAFTKAALWPLLKKKLQQYFKDFEPHIDYLDDIPENFFQGVGVEGVNLIRAAYEKSYYEYLFYHFKVARPLTFASPTERSEALKRFIDYGQGVEAQCRLLIQRLLSYIINNIRLHVKGVVPENELSAEQALADQVRFFIRNNEQILKGVAVKAGFAGLDLSDSAAVNSFNTVCKDDVKKQKIVQAMKIVAQLEMFLTDGIHECTQKVFDQPHTFDLQKYSISLWQKFKTQIDLALVAVEEINHQLKAYQRAGELSDLLESAGRQCMVVLTGEQAQEKTCVIS